MRWTIYLTHLSINTFSFYTSSVTFGDSFPSRGSLVLSLPNTSLLISTKSLPCVKGGKQQNLILYIVYRLTFFEPRDIKIYLTGLLSLRLLLTQNPPPSSEGGKQQNLIFYIVYRLTFFEPRDISWFSLYKKAHLLQQVCP